MGGSGYSKDRGPTTIAQLSFPWFLLVFLWDLGNCSHGLTSKGGSLSFASNTSNYSSKVPCKIFMNTPICLL